MGFFAGKSKPRCNELAEIFLQLKLSERSGRGVTKIYEKYGEDVFDINDDFIKVIIPFAYENRLLMRKDQNPSKIKRKSENKKEENRNLILNQIKMNPSITIAEISSNIKMSKATIQIYLKELVENNIIEREGSNKTGKWIIK